MSAAASSSDEFNMMELFRVEVETQCASLTDGLLALDRDSNAVDGLETLMRAAHSLKGAARIMNLSVSVRLAHAMEDCFVSAQRGERRLEATDVDLLLQGVDFLTRVAQREESQLENWEKEHQPQIEPLIGKLSTALPPHPGPLPRGEGTTAAASRPTGGAQIFPSGLTLLPLAPGENRGEGEVYPEASPRSEAVSASPEVSNPSVGVTGPSVSHAAAAGAATNDWRDRVLRVTADNLNRMLGLAGESLVESRSLLPFAESLLRLKRHQSDLAQTLQHLWATLTERSLDETAAVHLREAQQKALACRQFLADRQAELELFVRRSANLSHRLYREALASRMRPFADGIRGFPRLVRDLSRALGKEIRFQIVGEATQVDRDILDEIEAPLTHLLRNALDHGLESPQQRQEAGKPLEGLLRLEARHSAGMLMIVVSDDGRGIDLAKVRQAVVRKKHAVPEVAARLSNEELLEFLFLPGFSLKETVTEISGRGVGLDVVKSMITKVRGTVRIQSEPGRGTTFQLLLPLTLSVVRTLLAEIAGEPYAFPLARIRRTLKLSRDKIQSLEGRQHFIDGDQLIGLVGADAILNLPETNQACEELSLIILGDRQQRYGVVVDRFLGERELVVQALDPRLGKLKDISAAALMADGSPVLIIDVEEFVRSIETLARGGPVGKIRSTESNQNSKARKRVLVVDDSLTVRELERKLLESRGYEVEVAVDGREGWNALRTQHYDLTISDVDMPRMDGIELVGMIKKDDRLKSMPVMIVSYKDREDDRRRGLEAGADYYLSKGSFHDETLLQAVVDLVGEAA